jgi:hypothetical protein
MAKKRSKPSKGAALTAHNLGFGGLMLQGRLQTMATCILVVGRRP